MALEYPKVERDDQPSGALVFHCSDPDFRPAFAKIIKDLGLGKYDLYVRPAPSRALVEDPNAIKDIKTLHGLHNFGRIILLDHINCGGFGIPNEDEEIRSHFDYFRQGRKAVKQELPGVQFEPHLIGWEREITEDLTA